MDKPVTREDVIGIIDVKKGNNANLGSHQVLLQFMWLLLLGSIRGMHSRDNALLDPFSFIIGKYFSFAVFPDSYYLVLSFSVGTEHSILQ